MQESLKQNTVLKGLLIGLMAGLVVHMVDSVFMLRPRMYVPPDYPLVLGVFNLSLWSLVGLVSGVLMALLVGRERIREKEFFWWGIFFLLPFLLMYGIAGRIHIHPLPLTFSHPGLVYDNHLSFVWAALVLVYFLFRSYKQPGNGPAPFLLLCIEIVTIIALFQFCSNTRFFKLQTLHHRFSAGLSFPVFKAVAYAAVVLAVCGVYVVVCTKVRPILGRFRFMNSIAGLFVLFLVAASFSWGCFSLKSVHSQKAVYRNTSPPVGTARKDAPNIILIVLDTLRANRLGVYSGLKTSKNLDAFAQESLVFENCVATAPWTLASHASLFTGFYTSEHMCTEGLNEHAEKKKPFYLSGKFTTLAEAMLQNGYRTAGVTSNYGWMDPRFNIHQGFQVYDCRPSVGSLYVHYPFRPILLIFSFLTNIYPKAIVAYRTCDIINSTALQLMHDMQHEPFFMFINYMDVHGTYNPPRPYENLYLKERFPRLHRIRLTHARLDKRGDKQTYDTFVRSQYDGELTYLDDHLGYLFDELKQMGIYDSSLIIVTSDHGEFLGEHNLYQHQNRMYNEETMVPLIIKLPYSQKRGRVSGLINLVDIYPTVMSLCELPVPEGLSGKPFGGDSGMTVAELFSAIYGEHRVLYKGRYKYLQYGKKEWPDELYDVSVDPGESKNLIEELPETAAAMRAQLAEWKNTHKRKYSASHEETHGLSEEVKQNLKALGYMQ